MSYTFKPYRGYHVQDVVVDGKSMGQLDSYTFSSVSENHTIHVIFEKDEVKAEQTKLEHADSAGVQKSSPEKSQIPLILLEMKSGCWLELYPYLQCFVRHLSV